MTNLDRIKGSLVGGAVGDALGYPVEFLTRYEIIEKYGEKGITLYELEDGEALISDDTQMTLFTANAVIDAKKPTQLPEVLVKNYVDWLTTQSEGSEASDDATNPLLRVEGLFNNRDAGATCLTTLAMQNYGSVGYRANSSKGCGGVMRVAPIGLVLNYKDAGKYCAEAAAITHGHDLAILPAMCLGYILSGLRSELSLYNAVRAALKTIKTERASWVDCDAFIKKMTLAYKCATLGTADEVAFAMFGGTGGWCGDDALAIAVYCALKYENDFEAAITAAINHDGDSDSTGAITGNIMGAVVGYDAIPDKYKQNLEFVELIEEYADRLSKCPLATQS